jgi:hypothetical protein
MGGTRGYIEAPTKTELRKAVREWAKAMREVNWDIRAEYDPDRVEKTDKGYRIMVSAHT